ncbi:hypothetical protein [Bradyrhizobium liaoningense]|uniref:hypothetical protein n=1 Tax=Bradyrhizobium liaoningense TaxID=43992 RepID=UPI001BAB20FA|nr:hypothetical protein [Bradyrhizobium liaoningense]MBR0903881.1 hypothetical protein [Bradyrhizobium liaoningense]
MVAGGGAVSYAAGAVRSLISNSADPIKLTILTDSEADKAAYETMVSEIGAADVKVVSEDRCDQLAQEFYRPFPNIRSFRKGHPCWRKITDPSLFVESGQEVIVVDPDLYFPNIFRFEATLPGRLILMRQHRHCLLPPSVVERAFERNIALAHHTDIGVAHHTVLPWEWLENLIAELGGADLPRVAHIESIIWAAIAMQIGGGYLRASDWLCWERTVPKRALLMLGIGGPSLFRLEPLKSVKCFHASSGAKDWLLSAERRGIFRTGKVDRTSPSPLSPFVSISAEEFKRGERMKDTYHSLLRRLGLKDPLH